MLSLVPDAAEVVLAENPFNDPPAEGRQFFMVELAATYRGDESESVLWGLSMSVVGESLVAYGGFEDSCGVIPGDIDNSAEVFPGGTVIGNVCWQVGDGDADSLVLIVEEALSFDADRVFMALPPPGGRFEPPAPSESQLSVPGDGSLGSRANPVPAGVTARVGDWEVTVLSLVPDAAEVVLAENPFNDPPAEGRQFFMVELAATYRGDESESVLWGLSMSVVGESLVAYGGFEDSCGVIPGDIDNSAEVFPGGTVIGNVCWQVGDGDADSLVLIVEEALSFDADRVFMALPPPDA